MTPFLTGVRISSPLVQPLNAALLFFYDRIQQLPDGTLDALFEARHGYPVGSQEKTAPEDRTDLREHLYDTVNLLLRGDLGTTFSSHGDTFVLVGAPEDNTTLYDDAVMLEASGVMITADELHAQRVQARASG